MSKHGEERETAAEGGDRLKDSMGRAAEEEAIERDAPEGLDDQQAAMGSAVQSQLGDKPGNRRVD